MRCINWALFALLLCLLVSPVYAAGVLTPAATDGGSLPTGGTLNDCLINTAPGTGDWSACPGAAGGDSVSVDGVAVVDPNFDSTGDIDFVNTANTVTANVKANSVELGTDTTGNYAAGDAEGGAALTGDSATAFFSSGTIEDARLPASMADKTITGSLNIPHSTTLPATCNVGDQYMDTDATSGQRHYLCESANTWALQGGGPTAVTAASTFGTDNQLLRSDGTGRGAQASGVTLDDSDNMTVPGNLTVNGSISTAGAGPTLFNVTEGTAPGANATAGHHNCYIGSTDSRFACHENGDANPRIHLSDGAAEINALTAKSTPTTSDLLMIEDAASSNAKKKSTVDQVLAANDARSKTLTNTTLDAAGTGNSITIKQEHYNEVAGCNNATAGAVWNLPTSNAATAACDTGTNQFSAYMQFDDAANQSFHGSFRLPTGYSGGIDWLFRYKMDAGTTGAVGLCVQLVRLATGAAGDPAFPALAAGNCTSNTVPGTAGYEGEATISNVTCTSCVAGDRVFFRVSRDGNGTAVTDGATGKVRMVLSGPAYAVTY